MTLDVLPQLHGRSLLFGNVAERGKLYHPIPLAGGETGESALPKVFINAVEQGIFKIDSVYLNMERPLRSLFPCDVFAKLPKRAQSEIVGE